MRKEKEMAGGYMGKMLFVDLSTGEMHEEPLEEKMAREYIGGYGIGARIVYSRQKAGVDALGPENILGFVGGPMTGLTLPGAARYTVFAKSPLTGCWGDANSGGYFGPYMKRAGFDGVFFTGISSKPVYLLIDNGKAELKDAAHLWGKDTYETEDMLAVEYGRDSAAAVIGPAGELLSLVASVMTDRGSAAGRCGLGAVMGSKKLKAVVARGNTEIPVADKATLDNIRNEMLKLYRIVGPIGISPWEKHHKYGTSFTNFASAYSGDSPVKNWGGVGVVDFPDRQGLHHDVFATRVDKGHACYRCALACKAVLKAGEGEYKYAAGCRRPEYETAASFGTNILNGHTDSINMVNDICNRAGLDTISGGAIIAFATELYENGIITKADTDGIELKWGNHQAIVAMTEKMAKREGLGNILADGVKRAAEKIGKGAEQYAIHIGGQEVAFHDPKLLSTGPRSFTAARYIDDTPGRHSSLFGPLSFIDHHFLNMVGLCVMGRWPEKESRMVGVFNAVTGWNFTWEDMQKAGERTANLRHAFNLREGINILKFPIPPRVLGKPPQTAGPLAGVTVDWDAQVYWSLGALDWDRHTSKPSKAKLLSLGLDDVAKDLYP
jgi:aldehyde:ferredoxin oxidoreductase